MPEQGSPDRTPAAPTTGAPDPPRASRPGRSGPPTACRSSTSGRRRSRSTRRSRSRASDADGAGRRPDRPAARATPTAGSTTRRRPRSAGRSPSSRAPRTASRSRPGMAAIHAALVSLVSAGDRVVATSASYGTTRAQLDGRPRAGSASTTTFVDVTDLAAVERALAAAPTRVLYAETIANPTIVVADHAALAELAHRHGAPYVVDNTFASPYLCRPIELGADLVVESATKYLAGHSDVLAGVVSGRREPGRRDPERPGRHRRHARADVGVPRAARPLDARDPDGPPRGDGGGTRRLARASAGRDPRLPPGPRQPSPARGRRPASCAPAAGCSRSSSRAAATPAGRSSTP